LSIRKLKWRALTAHIESARHGVISSDVSDQDDVITIYQPSQTICTTLAISDLKLVLHVTTKGLQKPATPCSRPLSPGFVVFIPSDEEL
jgi:hypothetical protein